MSLTEGLHKGMVIRHEGQLYTVLDFRIAQTGKQKPTVHVKLRALASGNVGDRTLDQLGKLEEVPAAIRPMQYLYAADGQRMFMDAETFEQLPLDDAAVQDAIPVLVEGETYRIQLIEGKPVALQLPQAVVLEVTETAPVEHAGGSNVYKEAKVNSGVTVEVPLFIKTGDKIKVTTDDLKYQGKEH